MVVASQCLGDVKTAHATELLLLLEEEELVGLHIELATDTAIVVNHQIADAEGIQLLAAGQTCRTGTDNDNAASVVAVLVTALVFRLLIGLAGKVYVDGGVIAYAAA